MEPKSRSKRHAVRHQVDDLNFANYILDRCNRERKNSSAFEVLNFIISLANHRHSTKKKDISFKTRGERSRFLNRFFKDLKEKAGYRRLPDPRNLAQKHVQDMVKVWVHEGLSPSTISTYLSFLRAFSLWIRKPGLILSPDAYGLSTAQYARSGVAHCDKSWSAQGLDMVAVIDEIQKYDERVATMLRLIGAFGLRRKEAIMLRPHTCVILFQETGLAPDQKQCEHYLRINAGTKGGRLRDIPINTEQRLDAIEHAQALVSPGNYLSHPSMTLAQSLRHFSYIMQKFGLTQRQLRVTAHGLRHEALINHYEKLTGEKAPVRGGRSSGRKTRAARKEVAELAGHSRHRASSAYIG